MTENKEGIGQGVVKPHSVGPWTAIPFTDGYGSADWARFTIQSGGMNEYIIATVIGDVPDIPAEANARLIASAPALLEALKAVVAANDEYFAANPTGEPDPVTIACDQARAAIASAGGEK